MDHDEFAERFKELVVQAAVNAKKEQEASDQKILVDYVAQLAECCVEFYNDILRASVRSDYAMSPQAAEDLTSVFLAGILEGAFDDGN